MIRKVAVFLAVFATLAGPMFAQAGVFDRMIVIGDSLSDDGNLFAMTGGLLLPPPYSQGRASDGAVWVEYLAEELEIAEEFVHNHAVVGAKTGGGLLDAPPSIADPLGLNAGDLRIPSLGWQVQESRLNDQITANTLVVIWGGPNDIFFGQANNDVSVNNISQHIRKMALSGAKTFVIPNMPPLEKTPYGLSTDPQTQALLELISLDFNLQLMEELDALEQELNVTIIQFDVHTLLNDVIADPECYGFDDAMTSSIFLGSTDGYLFFDDVHPTTAGHKVLAEEAAIAIMAALLAP
jgi:phospholipase/lecithinase/hemolysin